MQALIALWSTIGPSAPFLVGGAVKIAYDLTLWWLFRRIPPPRRRRMDRRMRRARYRRIQPGGGGSGAQASCSRLLANRDCAHRAPAPKTASSSDNGM